MWQPEILTNSGIRSGRLHAKVIYRQPQRESVLKFVAFGKTALTFYASQNERPSVAPSRVTTLAVASLAAGFNPGISKCERVHKKHDCEFTLTGRLWRH